MAPSLSYSRTSFLTQCLIGPLVRYLTSLQLIFLLFQLDAFYCCHSPHNSPLLITAFPEPHFLDIRNVNGDFSSPLSPFQPILMTVTAYDAMREAKFPHQSEGGEREKKCSKWAFTYVFWKLNKSIASFSPCPLTSLLLGHLLKLIKKKNRRSSIPKIFIFHGF